MADIVPIKRIACKMYAIRDTRIILDRDLAELYGVETRVLNQAVKPRLCSRHLLRLENPCCNARFTILLLNIFMNMPSAQNRSNFASHCGFLRLATAPTAQSRIIDTILIV